MREDGREEMTLAFLEILESMKPEKLRSRGDGAVEVGEAEKIVAGRNF